MSAELSSFAQTFGEALRFLRKRAQLTQDELGRAVGYSREQIARLENGSRLPDLAMLAALFLPALRLPPNEAFAQQFLALAGKARGETPENTKPAAALSQTPSASGLFEKSTHLSLPIPRFPLIGRAQELQAIATLLQEEARLITLLGAPGIGKTRLALEIAHTLQPHFRDGVGFVTLESVQQAEDVPAAIVTALGVIPTAGEAPQATLQRHFASRHLLLVLDNCEHVLEAALLFDQWLSHAPLLKILCTSRVKLDLYGEYEWELGTLDLPDLACLPGVEELSQVASIQLFIARARTASIHFRLTPENALPIAALCVALDGLPLAIEIAATRAHERDSQTLLQQIIINKNPISLSSSLLQQTKRNVAHRHQTLQDAISWSYQLLSLACQTAFCKLGVMSGGCTLEAAQAICSADIQALQTLEAASLIRINADRITLLETLRTFAVEQLLATHSLTALQRQHAEYFAEYAQTIFRGMLGENQAHWIAQARLEQENIRAALRFALQQEEANLAVSLSGGLWWFWYRQGFILEGEKWLKASLECPLKAPLTPEQKRRRASALNGAGSTAAELNDFSAALRYHEEGLRLRQELEDEQGVAASLHNMALVARCQGNYAQAIHLLQEALEIEKKEPEQDTQIMFRANIGVTALLMYDLPLAREWLESALNFNTANNFPWEVGFTLNALGSVKFEQGDLNGAYQAAKQSEKIFIELGDSLFLPEPQLLLAKIEITREDFCAARKLCDQVFTQYQQVSDTHGISNALHVLAWVTLAEDSTPAGTARAAEMFAESLALRSQVARSLSPLEEQENQRLQQAIQQRQL